MSEPQATVPTEQPAAQPATPLPPFAVGEMPKGRGVANFEIQGWTGEGENRNARTYGEPFTSYRPARDAIRAQAKQLRANGREVKKTSEGRPLIYSVKEPDTVTTNAEGQEVKQEGMRWNLGIVAIRRPDGPADVQTTVQDPNAPKPEKAPRRKKKTETETVATTTDGTGLPPLATVAPPTAAVESGGDAAVATEPVPQPVEATA